MLPLFTRPTKSSKPMAQLLTILKQVRIKGVTKHLPGDVVLKRRLIHLMASQFVPLALMQANAAKQSHIYQKQDA